MGGKSLQDAFSGVNKLCQQCVKDCKQFKNVTVIRCKFVSSQKGKDNGQSDFPAFKRPLLGDTLQAQESAIYRGKDKVKTPRHTHIWVKP